MALQVDVRTEEQALLLAASNGFESAPVSITAPVSHFHEDYGARVESDDVDLTAATAEVARQNGEPCMRNVTGHVILGDVAPRG